jgi:hypothetical protein
MTEGLVLYGAAAVLMSIVTALGFKVANDETASATINSMAEDLSKAIVPGVKIIAGMSSAGLVPGLLYLYMQVANGKTVVPQNLISWVQNWLSKNGGYDSSTTYTNYNYPNRYKFSGGGSLQASDLFSGINRFTYKDFADHWPNDDFSNKYVWMLDAYDFGRGVEEVKLTRLLDLDLSKSKDVSTFGSARYAIRSLSDGSYRYTKDGGISSQYSGPNMSYYNNTLPFYVESPAKDHFYCMRISNGSVSSDTGFETGENVPGKDVLIPGEGTEGVTNEDIVGWLNSAVGQAVAEALGIGTEELQYVPVGVANPALTGEIPDVVANSTTQEAVQTGNTAADIVQSGNNTANVTFAQDSPISSVKASSLYTIWNPTQDQLNNLATFLWSTDFVDLIKKVLQSPMDAMISLALFPITPETDGTHVINLGYVPSGVSALRVSNQFQTFQTSGLVVPHKYNSYLDYSPYTTAEIYLPFIGFKSLNINDVMGKTVSVNYNIDMLSGTCTAIVKVDGNSMYSYSGNMALFLPLSAGNWARMMTSIFGAVGGVASIGAGVAGVMSGSALLGSTAAAVSGARTLGNLESNSVSRSGKISGNAGILGDYQPFIVITRPINDKPSTYNSNIGQTYNKSVQLGTLSGFTVVDEAHIEGMSATETEKKEIERLLKEGVIF